MEILDTGMGVKTKQKLSKHSTMFGQMDKKSGFQGKKIWKPRDLKGLSKLLDFHLSSAGDTSNLEIRIVSSFPSLFLGAIYGCC